MLSKPKPEGANGLVVSISMHRAEGRSHSRCWRGLARGDDLPELGTDLVTALAAWGEVHAGRCELGRRGRETGTWVDGRLTLWLLELRVGLARPGVDGQTVGAGGQTDGATEARHRQAEKRRGLGGGILMRVNSNKNGGGKRGARDSTLWRERVGERAGEFRSLGSPERERTTGGGLQAGDGKTSANTVTELGQAWGEGGHIVACRESTS